MSKRASRSWLLLALAALVAIGLFSWLGRSREPRVEAVSKAAVPAEARPHATEARAEEPSAVAARDEAPAPVETPATPKAELDSTPPPAKRTPDLAAREWITFVVENARGFPVGGAEIELNGLRTQREPGSHHAWRGDPSLGKTGADGKLKLAYPVWVNRDDETGEISFSVTHPDYATYEDHGRQVEPEIKVVLAMGSVLVVSGWIGEPSHVVTDVTAEFSWDVDVKPEDWLPRRDGRKTTTRVPQGQHLVYLRHESAEHVLFLSDMTEFALEAGETKELHLELKAPRQLTGRLDDVVPRPVIDGRVVLAVQLGSAARSGALLRLFDMPVEADGSFEIGGVMLGDAQVVALCKGWASKPQMLIHDDLDPVELDSEPLAFEPIPLLIAQIVDLRSDIDELVVAMEPTAALEVELHAPDGSPLAGASVDAWPNACWQVGACGLFFDDRSWSATTDERGIARIDNVPAGDHSFGVGHREYDLPLDPPGDANAQRSRRAHFEPGATVHLAFTLEQKSGG